MNVYTLFLSLSLAWAALGAPQKPDRVVKGTTQMAGDAGKFNVAYTLGKADPINITLLSARFTVEREIVAPGVIAPNRDEKLLVIDFVAHNPNSHAIRFGGGSVKFTGVDQESVNRDASSSFTRSKTGEVFSSDLKPAQKIELRAIIVVPAAGTVPKLILQHETGGPVLRYDLKPVLKPLVAPFADAKDETGTTAAEVLTCAPDTYYPMPWVDLKLMTDGVALLGQKFGNNVCAPIKQFCAVKFMVKGRSPKPAFLRFHAEVYDENGEKYDMAFAAQGGSEGYLNRSLQLDEEYAIRLVTIIPAKAKPKTIKVWDTAAGRNGRTYVFNLP